MAESKPITINGEPTLCGRIFEPRVGTWWVETDISADKVPSGRAELSFEDGGVVFVGTVESTRSVNDNETVSVRIEAGSGKLDTWIDAKSWDRPTVRDLLADATAFTGDTLSDKIDSSLLSKQFSSWTRSNTIVHRFVQDIADELGCAWRVLRDGTLWLGIETWPTVKSKATERERLSYENSVAIEPDAVPEVYPGSTYQSGRVAEVATSWTHLGITQVVQFEDRYIARHTRSIVTQIFDWVIRLFGTRLDLSALYPCKIVGQSDDLSAVDLIPDDARIRGQGITKVSLRYGLPGVRARVKNGARILLGFEAQDPKRPYASIWEHDSVEEIQIEPDADANVVIRTKGGGIVTVESESVIEIKSSDVRLGPAAGAGLALEGGMVAGYLPNMMAGPYPIAFIPGAPGVVPFVGSIANGSLTCKGSG
jgi:hypothetical protein